MRVLITGASGFVGRHLVRELCQHGHAPLALDVNQDRTLPRSVPSFSGDLLDAEMLRRLVARLRPEGCVHLAGQCFVPESWRAPERTLAVNILGTANLLEAFRQGAPTARVLVVSTAHIYGPAPREVPVTEEAPARPDTPYAVSKSAADQLTLLYARRHGLPFMTARPYNHIGPGQSPRFVVPAFARQLLAMKRPAAPATLKVGNLDSRRDFTDVRDVARAYRRLLEDGQAGQAYNIASGSDIAIGEILERLCRIIGVQPAVEKDPSLFRPTDVQVPLAVEKIRAAVQWAPEIPLDATLRDIAAEWTALEGAPAAGESPAGGG